MNRSPTPPPTKQDFSRWRSEGHRRGVSLAIGRGFAAARDAVARGLIAAGVTPNLLTLAGFLATCGAAVALLLGGSGSPTAPRAAGQPPYLLWAAAGLVLAGAFDMLDGAVARLGGLSTPLGAVLDSCVDRFSDLVIYLALIGHFVIRGNATYAVLAAAALSNAFLISYVKARSECLIRSCAVGYWMRGERSAALLIAVVAGGVPAVLWQQAILPALTVLRRLVWTWQCLTAAAAGRPTPENRPPPGWRGLARPWRYPRGSIPYDLVTGVNIAFIVFGGAVSPFFGPDADPLRAWLG